MKYLFTLALSLVLLSGCDLYPQDDYSEQYVIDAWLIALEPMPDIRLSTTAPISEFFDVQARGVSEALVVVHMMSDSGDAEWTGIFEHLQHGVYSLTDSSHIIQPNRTYSLEITTPANRIIRASTTVPDTFRVVNVNTRSLPYQSAERFTLDLTRSVNPNRQSYYVFSSETLDPINAELTPFYANFDAERDDFFIVSSGIINEANSRRFGSDFVELVYPWIGIAFYGPNRLQAAAVDDNIFDFIRTAGTQLGGGTQSPGEIENLLYNIDGGIGIFGSYSRITLDVNIEKPTFQ
ncbi:MAG: DUF4249 family protein [Bacteroidetes bacterium]|nr:DUF4249 family protein [Bacteroidota bacterium]MCH8523097.1 DUF4249 domain-containing protein [Balneolales bacterium]